MMNNTMTFQLYVNGNPIYVRAKTKTQALNWARQQYRGHGICTTGLRQWKQFEKQRLAK